MALPLVAAPEAGAATAFRQRLDELRDHHRGLWLSTPERTPRVGPPVGRWRRWRNARATRGLIDRVAGEIRRYPEAEGERRDWRDALRETVRRFGEERLGWPAGYRQLFFADAFFDSTAAFSREARAFDPELGTEELMQALRNVWILNSIQMLLDREVGYTPAVFAYSMLYPVTDNLLDDPELPMADKRLLNSRLGRRLAGEEIAAGSEAERRIWELLDHIESQYPQAGHPDVWASLRAIHDGQVASLKQQAGPLDDDGLLAISIAKGGASVLADGYLAAGGLSRSEAEFCFGYGVFLQLLDDLQDARADAQAGHATLFSTATPPLDRLAGRLYRFMHRVVEGSERFGGPVFAARRDLILRNCRTLLIGAVAEEPRLFSRSLPRPRAALAAGSRRAAPPAPLRRPPPARDGGRDAPPPRCRVALRPDRVGGRSRHSPAAEQPTRPRHSWRAPRRRRAAPSPPAPRRSARRGRSAWR